MGIFGKFFQEKPPAPRPADSSVDRYVGHDDEAWAPGKADLEKTFADQRRNETASREVPKTREDLEMLKLVDRETDALRERYGLPSFSIPPENVHLMPPDDPALPKGSGKFKMADQAMYLRANDPPVIKMLTAFHEMVHFKAFQSIHAEDGVQKIRRAGLRARQGADSCPRDFPKRHIR